MSEGQRNLSNMVEVAKCHFGYKPKVGSGSKFNPPTHSQFGCEVMNALSCNIQAKHAWMKIQS